MSTSPTAASPVVSLADGRAVTTSQDVARVFGKLHKHVLDAIENLRTELPTDFDRPNFRPVEHRDAKGELRPAYRLTRDGFTLLAMGFTGKRALQFKLAYIDAFNRMEAAVLGLDSAPSIAIPPPAKAFVRTQVVMSGELHRKLKVKAITEGSTIRQLMIDAAEHTVRDFDLHRALEDRS